MRTTPEKVLVANRGEIAVRVIRACHEVGARAVACFSEPDRAALHVRLADEAYAIGGARASESYLSAERLLAVARESGCDAVHPGYGFLSENAEFAEAVEAAGLAFIGPRAETIRLMGDKVAARREAEAAGVPVVPGGIEPISGEEDLRARAEEIGYPLILKAAAGGGGKGIRVVRAPEELLSAFERASSEARSAFGNGAVYLERFLTAARHIEVQVLGDGNGAAVHFGERECSLQRRHQKLVEEAPSPSIGEALRARLTAAAVSLVQRIRYRGAGTVEFLVEGAGSEAPRFYFMEMNTRLQVEHPVTEMVTGIDLVREQLFVAAQGSLALTQAEIEVRGAALEARVYAEDPRRGFVPSTGRVEALAIPCGPGTRVDTALFVGDRISVHYDPLIAKVICWGRDRQEACDRLGRALREMRIVGVTTTIPLLRRLALDPDFRAAAFDIHWLEPFARRAVEEAPTARRRKRAAVAAAVRAALRARTGSRRVGGATPAGGADGVGGPGLWAAAGRAAQHGRGGLR